MPFIYKIKFLPIILTLLVGVCCSSREAQRKDVDIDSLAVKRSKYLMTMYGEDSGIKKYIVLPMRSCPTCKNKVIDFLKANVDALAVQRDLSIIVIEMPANARNLKIELGNQLIKIVHFDFTNNTDSIFESPCLILRSDQSNFKYIDLAQVDIQKYKDALISK